MKGVMTGEAPPTMQFLNSSRVQSMHSFPRWAKARPKVLTARHFPRRQTLLWQSAAPMHARSAEHLLQIGPPQSTSVSCPFSVPSVHAPQHSGCEEMRIGNLMFASSAAIEAALGSPPEPPQRLHTHWNAQVACALAIFAVAASCAP
jgi:hypothetical protein